jgi:parallel beta-helix repeat protein
MVVSATGAEHKADSEATVHQAVAHASPGDVIAVKPGVYLLTRSIQLLRSGTDAKPITLRPDGDGRIVFIARKLPPGKPAILVQAQYWSLSKISVHQAQGDGGFGFECLDAAHVVIENCEASFCDDSGFQLYNCDQVTIRDSTSHNNHDPQNLGENADGFAIKGGSRNCVLSNCAAFWNSDDGYDLWESIDCRLEGCRAFENGFDSNGDGNGFKLGASNGSQSGRQTVVGCLAWRNQGAGFDENESLHASSIIHCTSWGNKFGYVAYRKDSLIVNSISYQDSKPYYFGADVMHRGNSWNLSIQDPGFESMDPERNDFLNLKRASPCRGAGIRTDESKEGAAIDIGHTGSRKF